MLEKLEKMRNNLTAGSIDATSPDSSWSLGLGKEEQTLPRVNSDSNWVSEFGE
jgi:hypothetical protein